MLVAVAREAAERFGPRIAFADARWPDRAVSYADLDRLSDEVAAWLAGHGVVEGDVVVLALSAAIEYPVCYLAAAKLGAATAGISARLAPAQQVELVDVAAPRLVITDHDLQSGYPTVRIDTEEATGDDLLAAVRARGLVVPPIDDDPDRPVAICFTSGTTGTPRGAVFAGRQLAAITAVDVGDDWGGGAPAIAGTTFAHLGPMTKLPGALRRGTSTNVMRTWRADDALDLIARFRVPTVAGVPTQIALLLAQPEFERRDLSTVGLVVVGGGPAAPSLIRAARERFGAPVATRYSCTEAGIGCATSPDDPAEDAEQTVGRPQAGVELAIRTDGDPVAPGAVGEVLLRSAALMSHYHRDPTATAEVLTDDGFVRTGDLGWGDDRGRLHLVGRTKEMYVRGGENVYPVRVEAVLAEHPLVRDIAIVGVDDDVMGEVGVAVVVAVPGRSVTAEDLREVADGRLARHELPDRVVLADAVPLTAADKVDRAALRALVARREA